MWCVCVCVCGVIGAVREEWKIAMRKQVSQISQVRAQEQKVAEMTQKMYEEEEEEEEEMTDTGKSSLLYIFIILMILYRLLFVQIPVMKNFWRSQL